jgi:hypothetical protein
MPTLYIPPGLDLHYLVDDYTDPWRTPGTILLLHGNAESGAAWYAWVPRLAERRGSNALPSRAANTARVTDERRAIPRSPRPLAFRASSRCCACRSVSASRILAGVDDLVGRGLPAGFLAPLIVLVGDLGHLVHRSIGERQPQAMGGGVRDRISPPACPNRMSRGLPPGAPQRLSPPPCGGTCPAPAKGTLRRAAGRAGGLQRRAGLREKCFKLPTKRRVGADATACPNGAGRQLSPAGACTICACRVS